MDVDLTRRDDVPAGTVTSGLDFPLSNCVLAYGRWAYKLGTLEPDEAAILGADTDRCCLKTLLTGRQMSADEPEELLRQEVTPFDTSSQETPYILRAMMFYEGIEGRQYTKLSHAYQGFVDFSDLLQMNRAVLVARAPAGRIGAELLCKDQRGQSPAEPPGEHLTIYRFVFPVKPEDNDR